MILSNKNDLLYDAKNFNKYRNIYAVLVNYGKIDDIQDNISKYAGKITDEYDHVNNEVKLIFLNEEYLNLKGIYKIIFGHYYNNQNLFLYKNLRDKKIVTTNIHQCKYNELLYNNTKDLIYSNSYDALKKQVDIIVQIKENRIKDNLLPIDVSYEEGTVNIETNGKLSTSFSDGCLQINNK